MNLKANFEDRFSVPVAASLLLSAVVLRVGWLLHKGILTTSDFTDYTGVCGTWRTDPLAVIGGHVGIEYAGFTLPFCAVYGAAGDWNLAWIGVQIFMSSVACVLIYDATRRYVGQLGGVTAGIVLVILFDSFRYSVYMLSETTFIFTLTLAMWAIARYRKDPTRQARVVAWVCVLWMAFSRPFGIPILGLWLLTDLRPTRSSLRVGLSDQRKVVAGGFVLVGTTFVLSSRVGWIDSGLLSIWKSGWVFFLADSPVSLPDLSYDPIEASNPVLFAIYNADHLVVLAVFKSVAFFLPAYPGLARNTTLQLGALVYTPICLASFAGLVRAARCRSQVFVTAAVPLLAITAVVAITFVTPHFRYRSSLGPLFAMLTGYLVATINNEGGFDTYKIALSRYQPSTFR